MISAPISTEEFPRKNRSYMHSDGFHILNLGVKVLVNQLRANCNDNCIVSSAIEVTSRPKLEASKLRSVKRSDNPSISEKDSNN